MTNGTLYSPIQNPPAEGDVRGRWDPSARRNGEEALWDAPGQLHLHVELPSRRWYLDAAVPAERD